MELTLEEAATRLGKSPRQVRYMIRNKSLPARKAAGRWLVEMDALPRSQGQTDAARRKEVALRAAVDEALALPERSTAARYSLRNLKAFQLGLPLYERATAELGAEHDASVHLRATLGQLARGCHRYEPRDKAEAYRAAREHASVAVCELFLCRGERPDALAAAVEAELLTSIAGLLRRADRSGLERRRA